MLAVMDRAMLELQGAMTARSLYPRRHPHIRAGERRALTLFSEILAERPEITLFAVGERVILDDQVLPSSASLSASFFSGLRRCGADRFTLTQGVEAVEIRNFLDRLAESETDGEISLDSSPHLSFGYFKDDTDDTRRTPSDFDIPLPVALVDTLDDVWRGLHNGDGLDTDALGDIVSSVSRAVADSASVMLPLAGLKKHDEYTFIHTINVAILSTALGETVGFKGAAAHELNMAALLHDVGKKKVPESVLNKAGKFSDEEFRLMQKHPIEGARMLFNTPGVPDIAPIVAFEHHVRADLSGYPKVPRGWRLSLASRIVQIADVFDALRTHRPYRPALTVAEIMEIMQKDVGSFFDADLLHAFFERVISRGVPNRSQVFD